MNLYALKTCRNFNHSVLVAKKVSDVAKWRDTPSEQKTTL